MYIKSLKVQMKLGLEDKRKAIALRQDGYTNNEIRKIIPNLSKGTISGWLKNIELSPEHRKRKIQTTKDAAGSRLQRVKFTGKYQSGLKC